MIVVCENFEKRLDHIWYQLQKIELERRGSISQYELDEVCIEWLERMVERKSTNYERFRQ